MRSRPCETGGLIRRADQIFFDRLQEVIDQRLRDATLPFLPSLAGEMVDNWQCRRPIKPSSPEYLSLDSHLTN
jgi:hypothetical protein